MKIGMTLPVTEPGWTREILLQWVERIENGPYSTLALGERTCFPSPELLTTLGACAALTSRVQLATTVIILPTHNPVTLAKQLATVDLISEGRLTVGVGTGGREEDYHAAGTPLDQKRLAVMASHVETLCDVWSGEHRVEGALLPVEPYPVQENGPTLLAGVMGPKGLANAAQWADGISGMSMTGQADEASAAFAAASDAWQAAGRTKQPLLNTAFWFAVGDNADEQMHTHLHRYFNWLDDESRDFMVKQGGFRGSPEQLLDRLQAFANTGADELLLIPTSIDPQQLDTVSQVIREFQG